MKAVDMNYEIARRARARGIVLETEDAATLRKAEKALQRWAERECGDGSAYCVCRDEKTGVPYEHEVDNWDRKHKIQDRERNALRRCREVCERLGIHFFHQTDPRGSMVYIGREPLTDQTYSQQGVCCGI